MNSQMDYIPRQSPSSSTYGHHLTHCLQPNHQAGRPRGGGPHPCLGAPLHTCIFTSYMIMSLRLHARPLVQKTRFKVKQWPYTACLRVFQAFILFSVTIVNIQRPFYEAGRHCNSATRDDKNMFF